MYSEKGYDYLDGGAGFDTYLVSHHDVINDADLSGLIMFNNKSLSGTKTQMNGNDTAYEDANFVYILNRLSMTVIEKTTLEYITIGNFNFDISGLGINFEKDNEKNVEIYVGDATVTEGGSLAFTVGINTTLENDLTINLDAYFNGSADASDITMPQATAIIKAGSSSVDITVNTVDDEIVEETENFIFAVTGQKYTPSENESEDRSF